EAALSRAAGRGGLGGGVSRHDGLSWVRGTGRATRGVAASVDGLAPAVGDGQAAVAAERESGDLGARRVLAALPLGAVDERDDLVDDLRVEPAREELRAALGVLDVRVEHLVEQVVRRERVLVGLAGPQLRRRRLGDGRLGDRRDLAAVDREVVAPPRELPHARLVDVLERRETADAARV